MRQEKSKSSGNQPKISAWISLIACAMSVPTALATLLSTLFLSTTTSWWLLTATVGLLAVGLASVTFEAIASRKGMRA